MNICCDTKQKRNLKKCFTLFLKLGTKLPNISQKLGNRTYVFVPIFFSVYVKNWFALSKTKLRFFEACAFHKLVSEFTNMVQLIGHQVEK